MEGTGWVARHHSVRAIGDLRCVLHGVVDGMVAITDYRDADEGEEYRALSHRGDRGHEGSGHHNEYHEHSDGTVAADDLPRSSRK